MTSTSPQRAIDAYGGRTLGRPVAIGALSRTLIAVDPGGVVLRRLGAGRPARAAASSTSRGRSTWNELLTRDYDQVQDFQFGVFGHEFTDETEPGGPRWATAHTGDGNPAYGLAEIDGEWPAGDPAALGRVLRDPQRRARAWRGRSTSARRCCRAPSTAPTGSAPC